MSIHEKSNDELLKEALARANKLEKQEYENIEQKRIANVKRFCAIMKEWQDILDERKRKEHPREPPASKKPTCEMSTDEYIQENRAQSKYMQDCLEWNTADIATNTKQIAKANQLLELIIENMAIEQETKWLLLSIALRSQPNLLKYIK